MHPADAVQLLNGIHECARGAGTTIYALRRDHKQGFDKLHASAFEDATLLFERARTVEARMVVKTHYDLSNQAIVTQGHCKQGDPTSSFKYCLVISMLWWYWPYAPQFSKLSPSISTVNAGQNREHTPQQTALSCGSPLSWPRTIRL